MSRRKFLIAVSLVLSFISPLIGPDWNFNIRVFVFHL